MILILFFFSIKQIYNWIECVCEQWSVHIASSFIDKTSLWMSGFEF